MAKQTKAEKAATEAAAQDQGGFDPAATGVAVDAMNDIFGDPSSPALDMGTVPGVVTREEIDQNLPVEGDIFDQSGPIGPSTSEILEAVNEVSNVVDDKFKEMAQDFVTLQKSVDAGKPALEGLNKRLDELTKQVTQLVGLITPVLGGSPASENGKPVTPVQSTKTPTQPVPVVEAQTNPKPTAITTDPAKDPALIPDSIKQTILANTVKVKDRAMSVKDFATSVCNYFSKEEVMQQTKCQPPTPHQILAFLHENKLVNAKSQVVGWQATK